MQPGHPLRELVDSFSELTAQHLRLAKTELAEDARFVGVRVAVIGVLAPLILVGWGFLCVAAALGLSRVVPMAAAFVIVGVVNLLFGGVGTALAARQLRSRRVMAQTMDELESTSAIMVHREAP